MSEQSDIDNVDPIPGLFPSMSAAAGALFMPRSVLQWAKKQGCDAFESSGRVKTRRLLSWLAKRDQSEGDVNWLDRKNEYQAKREKVKLDKELRQTLEKAETTAAIHKGESVLFSALDRIVTVEAPPALKGQDESHIQAYLLAALERVKSDARASWQKLLENGE